MESAQQAECRQQGATIGRGLDVGYVARSPMRRNATSTGPWQDPDAGSI